MKVRLVLGVIALVLVVIGMALWVDAGTRHMESRPETAELMSGGSPADGPNRFAAQLTWAGAALCLVGAVSYRSRA